MTLNKMAYHIILMGFFCLFFKSSFGQNQKVADSLAVIYKENKLGGLEKLELLRNLSFNEITDSKLSMKYADELIALSKKEQNQIYLYRGFRQKASNFQKAGDFEYALQANIESSKAAQEAKYLGGIGSSYTSIADVYSEMGNSTNAENYYTMAIDILRQSKDSISLASALLNAGDESFNTKKYDKALSYFEESGNIFRKANYLIGTAYNKGNIGMVHAELGNGTLAARNINEAINILEDMQDYYAISEYLTYMSNIFRNQNDWSSALSYAERSLELAKKYGLKKQISESNLTLSELYEQYGHQKEALTYYKNFIQYRDSLLNLESVQNMANLRTDFEVSKKQTEVDLLEKDSEIIQLKQKRQRSFMYIMLIVLFFILILAYGLQRRYNFIKATKKVIEDEKARSDHLLRNILPLETAEELKQNGKVRAKKFESVTVLFTDFKGFTSYAESLSPEDLVESIDFYFSKFDQIMETYGLEKIKTVGDAYMCAGGLPFATKDHAHKMLMAAFDIVDFVNASNMTNTTNKTRYEIRVGINTGPVVAGVVGTKKFAYDIWGDTVNVASRMESNSEPGKVNISQNTYNLIKDTFECEYRGKIDVKNRGMMNMYFVNRKDLNNSHKLVMETSSINNKT